jgi:membrane fusion protein, heavy metal efflux system
MARVPTSCLLAILGTVGCSRTAGNTGTATSPEKPKAESELAFTALSKKAYLAAQIKTEPAKVQEVQERLPLTAWVMAKPGHEVPLTAPNAGYVRFADVNHVPIAGEQVKAGQDLLHLEPVLSRSEQLQVASMKRGIESDLAKAQATLAAASKDLKRTLDLVSEKAVNQQLLEQAQKAFDHATEDVKSAKEKLTYFQNPTIKLTAPIAGTVLQLYVGPGQYVPVSAPLITIIDLQPVWVRVPVREFDVPLVDAMKNVSMTWKNPNHDHGAGADFFTAIPKGRVALVDPQKRTVDLWYELEVKNSGRFVKDQMLTAYVPIDKKEKATIVPYAAVVFDAYGHAWVYLERTADKDAKHLFERRRIELASAGDGGLIIRPPLAVGDRVVVNGAAVLFSREFFKAPVHIPGEDD